MSILDRLNLLIRSEINDVARPDRLRNTMSEMESSLADARKQNAHLRVTEKKLIAQIRAARDKATTWEDRAVLALKSGQEDLAREALRMKNTVLAELEKLRDELDEHRAYIKDMERAVEALEMKLRGARGRIEPERSTGSVSSESAWDAEFRRRTGENTGRPHPSTVSEQPGGAFEDIGHRAFEAFDRMADKIRGLEASVQADDELEDPLIDPKRKAVDDSFKRLEQRQRTNDDLADLKKKFS